MSVTLDQEFKLSGEDVFLTILIDNAQIGTSKAEVNEEELARGEIENLKLGSNLKGKVLRVKTVVTDVNDNTNKMRVRYKIHDGNSESEIALTSTVENEGDSEIFKLNVTFK